MKPLSLTMAGETRTAWVPEMTEPQKHPIDWPAIIQGDLKRFVLALQAGLPVEAARRLSMVPPVYDGQVGANLRAAEGTLAERDEQIARLKDEIASLRPRERLHEAESAVIRFVRAEMALSHYLDGDQEQEGVEADLAEEETESMDAIRALGRKILGFVEPVEGAAMKQLCAEPDPQGAQLVDIMGALRASLNARNGSR